MKTSNYWDKRALKRLTEAEKSSEKYIKRVKGIYNQAYKDIDRQIKNIYKNYSDDAGLDIQKLKELLTRSETKKTWKQMKHQGLDKYIKDNYKNRISRLEQLKAQIYAKAKMIYPKEELENTMCYKGIINKSYYKTMYDTQMGTGYNFNFSTIDNNMVEELLNEPWSGKNYSERIWGNTDILADSLSQILGGAMLSGQSIQLTSRQIRDRFNVSKYYAERLIRTETNHFNNEADAIAYEELGLDKYVFVATLDSRTSEICQSMDNKVFDLSEREEGINYPPLHPNCRSKTRAYLGQEEENGLQRRARNPITGKTELIGNVSYRNWINQYGLGANGLNNTIKNHPKPKYLGNINPKDNKRINKILNNYENIIKNAKIENAIVITKAGDIYQCMGNANSVWVDIDLGDKLKGAIVTHNHPKEETYFSFSEMDINLFDKYKLKRLRGIDYKYTYELNRTKKPILTMPIDYNNTYGYEHLLAIDYSLKNNIYYNRWKNE